MRILIVEDERESREGLAALLHSLMPSALVDMAENAAAGLALLDQKDVQLIFLDIKMPDMDGLEMLTLIRSKYGNLPVVILSAYDQFCYAQKAIRLGALDYLLKPYTSEAIQGVLRIVCNDKTQHDARGSHSMLISTICQCLDDPAHDTDALLQLMAQESTDDHPVDGRLLLLIPSEENSIFKVSKAFENVLLSSTLSLHSSILIFPYHEQVIALLCTYEEPYDLSSTLEGVMYTLKMQANISHHLVLSNRYTNLLEHVRFAYSQARGLAEFSLYFRPMSLLTAHNTAVDMQRSPSSYHLEALQAALLSGEPDEMQTLMDAMRIDACRTPYMMPQRLIYELHKVINHVLSAIKEHLLHEQYERFNKRLIAQSHAPGYIDDYFTGLAALCVEIAEAVRNYQGTRSNVVLKHCMDYIDANYANPELTLASCADYFHFSAGYFGAIFKTATTKAFTQYLRDLRIRKACDLLADPAMKICDIAVRTGFADAHYFIRVFGKCMSCSPNQFRTRTDDERLRLLERAHLGNDL